MAVRTIVTASSVWVVDLDKHEFNRSPRVEGGDHPFIKYDKDNWVPYSSMEDLVTDNGTRTFFNFQEDHPIYGRFVATGAHEGSIVLPLEEE